MNSRFLLLVLSLFTVVLTGCGARTTDAAPVFRFSAIPDEKQTERAARFAPVAAYLAKSLGVRVEYVATNDYAASVQAFKNREIQAAWFGGLTGVQARQAVAGARAIAQGDADPQFFSYFIAHKGSGLTTSETFPVAAAGKKLTFGSASSTSGRLMPEFFIRKHTGKAPKSFFAAVGFSGNHPATLAAVNSGAFDLGVLSYTVYDKASAEAKANTFVLWKTPHYADYNFTVHGDLDKTFGAGFTERLTKAWLAMPTALTQPSFSRGSMIPASNRDFARIETTAVALGLAR